MQSLNERAKWNKYLSAIGVFYRELPQVIMHEAPKDLHVDMEDQVKKN